MIKKLRVAVDHGNRNMKTCNFVFTTGLTEQDKKPARGEKYLKYQGKYYTLSEKRIPYQRDKTQDSRNRFWILTLCDGAGTENADPAGGCHSGGTSDWASAEAFCRAL